MEAKPNTTWELSYIPSLEGKVAVVTGANSGIEFATALELARNNAHVVLACRSPERGQDAERRIRNELASDATKVEFMRLDLADLSSVRAFAAAFLDKFDRLDILVNNAGLMLPEQTHTESGLEMQFAVNYVGHFLLTQLLFDVLTRGDSPSRVVAVSSLGHRFAKLDLSTLARLKPGESAGMNGYFCSKLANLLFTYELDRRVRSAGLSGKVLAVAAHPGIASSEISFKRMPKWLEGVLRSVLPNMKMRTASDDAMPSLFAATDLSVRGGEFFGSNGLWAICGTPALERSSVESYSEELATKLWAMSEESAACSFIIRDSTERLRGARCVFVLKLKFESWICCVRWSRRRVWREIM